MENNALDYSLLEMLQKELSLADFSGCLQQFQKEITERMETLLGNVLDRSWEKVCNECIALQGISSAMGAHHLAGYSGRCAEFTQEEQEAEFFDYLPVMFKEVNVVKQACESYYCSLKTQQDSEI